jgi:FkbM family methyltransferase
MVNTATTQEQNDNFLKNITGVIHVGANDGGERFTYNQLGLDVLWVEPIPWVFEELTKNLAGFPKQKALNALITDIDDKEYEFFISNNAGHSSSILGLKDHKAVWPSVFYTKSIKLQSTTLPTLLKRENVDRSKYQAMVIDAQGAELLILKASTSILGDFKYVKTEAPDFESYEGCCTVSDIETFMKEQGFVELSRHKFIQKDGVGNYFDVVYKKA